jgi:hypothetical protein
MHLAVRVENRQLLLEIAPLFFSGASSFSLAKLAQVLEHQSTFSFAKLARVSELESGICGLFVACRARVLLLAVSVNARVCCLLLEAQGMHVAETGGRGWHVGRTSACASTEREESSGKYSQKGQMF